MEKVCFNFHVTENQEMQIPIIQSAMNHLRTEKNGCVAYSQWYHEECFYEIMVKGCCIKFLLTFYIKNIISVILSLCDSAVLY